MADMFGKATWDVFCPFKGVTSRVEVKLTDKGWRGSSLYPTVRRGSFRQPVASQGTAVEVGTLDVSSKDYLVFEVRGRGEQSARGPSTRVVLSYPHMRKFLEGLRQAELMLIPPPDTETDTYARPFEPTDNGLIRLTEHGEKWASAKVSGLYDGASIEFVPIIWEHESGTEETSPVAVGDAGVRMYVNSYEKFGECTLEDFLAFTHFHERFSLFDVSREAITLAAASGSLTVSVKGAGRDGSGTVEQPMRRQK